MRTPTEGEAHQQGNRQYSPAFFPRWGGGLGGRAISRNRSNRPSGAREKNSFYRCSNTRLCEERLSSGLKVAFRLCPSTGALKPVTFRSVQGPDKDEGVYASLEVPGNHNALPGSPLPLSSVSILSSPDLDEVSHCAVFLISVRGRQGLSPLLGALLLNSVREENQMPLQGTFRRLAEGSRRGRKNWKSRKKRLTST